MLQIMADAIVALKNILHDLKIIFLKKGAKRRVNDIYNKHKSFNLT
jgi:hypothetical protein